MSTTATPHIGRKISRIRELRGMKQEALAIELGISQQSVSHLEQSETVETEKLEQVAKVLGVTPEAIKNYSDEAIVNYFNTFNEKVSNSNFGHHNTCMYFQPFG
jgi:transcriptional regulator with XRE-family HTH domain